MTRKTSAIYVDATTRQPVHVDARTAKRILAEFPETEFFSEGHRVYPRVAGYSSGFAYWPNEYRGTGETAPETRVHRFAKDEMLGLLRESTRLSFALPGRSGADAPWTPFVDVLDARPEVRIQNPLTGDVIQPDVFLRVRQSPLGHWIGIEFRNTHAVDARKQFLIRRERISALEIDLIDFVEIAPALHETRLRSMMREFLASTIPAKALAIVRREDRRAHDDEQLVAAIRHSRLAR